MPHLNLEVSENIQRNFEVKTLLQNLHQILIDTGYFKEPDIKSRINYYQDYFIGNGASNKAFVHLNIAILEGRPLEILDKVKRDLYISLCKGFSQSIEGLDCEFSLEFREMRKDLYMKEGW